MYFGQFLGLFWLGSSRFDTVTAFYDMFIVHMYWLSLSLSLLALNMNFL